MFQNHVVLQDNRGEEKTFDNPVVAASHARECVQRGVSVQTQNPLDPVHIDMWRYNPEFPESRDPKPMRRFYNKSR